MYWCSSPRLFCRGIRISIGVLIERINVFAAWRIGDVHACVLLPQGGRLLGCCLARSVPRVLVEKHEPHREVGLGGALAQLMHVVGIACALLHDDTVYIR